jgi:hypothetical protein
VKLVIVAAVVAGCGGGDDPRASLADHQAEVDRNPYALTCGDLARQPDNSTNQRLVIHAEFALADAPALRKRVDDMTSNRVGRSIYWALTEICKDRPDSYKPADAAVQAVREGKYLVQPRPESWSHPEEWSDPVVKELKKSAPR